MNCNPDIYVRVNRMGRKESICLIDVTEEELSSVFLDKSDGWLRYATARVFCSLYSAIDMYRELTPKEIKELLPEITVCKRHSFTEVVSIEKTWEYNSISFINILKDKDRDWLLRTIVQLLAAAKCYNKMFGYDS